MRGRFQPQLDRLTDRITPAVFGTPWPSPTVTLSFAPDGTDANGAASDTGTALTGIPVDVWRGEVLRAFQAWAAVANVNVAVVADGGQPFGTPGAPQGDVRFGDVRIGAVPLAPTAAALATPFDLNAGTRSGDIWFNSALPFSVGGGSGNDVFAVALHEAGHIFGVPENDDPTSAMYDVALPRAGLNAADIAAMTSLYGARRSDAFDAKGANDALKAATSVQVGSGPGSSATANVTADITAATDLDTFVFQPSNLRGAGMTAAVHTAGVSLLVPELEILDAGGRVIAAGVGARPGSGDVTLHLDGLVSGGTYFARVSAGRADGFGVGGYKLELRPDAASAGGGGTPQLVNPDAGSNDTQGTASQLGQQLLTAFGGHTAYNVAASLNTSTDIDFYRVKSPQTAGNAPGTLTATVWTTPPDATDPVIDVFDARGNRVAGAILVHDGGAFTVQVANAQANADYYVAVRHARPGAGAAVGNYTLNVDFGGTVAPLADAARNALTATAPVSVTPLAINETQVLHLVLDLTANPPGSTVARVMVVDSQGTVADTRLVPAGGSASLNVFLKPGQYRVVIGAATTDGSALQPLAFALRWLTLSDPIGPLPVSTTTQPVGTPIAPAPITTAPPTDWGTTGLYVPVSPVSPISPPWWIAPSLDQFSLSALLTWGLISK